VEKGRDLLDGEEEGRRAAAITERLKMAINTLQRLRNDLLSPHPVE
jgi:hypothetical protein